MGKTLDIDKVYLGFRLAEKFNKDEQFRNEIESALNKFVNCDFGDLCGDDISANLEAIEKKIEKVYGNYFSKYGNVLIITEMYNLCTTIMFADEY